jgi:adenosine deaminase
MSISTDGRTISNVTLAQEYEKLQTYFGWQEAHFLRCNLAAIDAAFIPDGRKEELKSRFLTLWALGMTNDE